MTPRRTLTLGVAAVLAAVAGLVVAHSSSGPIGTTAVALVAAGPASQAQAAGPVAAQVPAPDEAEPAVPAQTVRAGVLTATLAALASQSTVDFAVAVVDHRTGTTYEFDGDQPFATASVVKVDILATLLLQNQRAGRTLTSFQQDLADVMIRQSDNDAASTLWTMIGDEVGLTTANAVFGLTETTAGTDGYWGMTTTTARDQVRLLDAIADPAGPLGTANATVLDLMGQVVSSQSWGISAAARSGEATLLKNGWLSVDADGGLWAVNSIGRITGDGTDVTIAVLTRGNATMSDGVDLVQRLATLTRTQLEW